MATGGPFATVRKPNALLLRVYAASRKDAIHGIRALDEHRPDLLAIDGLGRRCTTMANESGNVLNRDASVGHQ